VTTVLEAMRALHAGSTLRNDVIVLFADGQTLGGLGVRSFVEGHPWMREVAYVVSVSPGGGGAPSWLVPFERGAEVDGGVGRRTSLSAVLRPLDVGGETSRPFVQAGVAGATLYSPDDGGRTGTVRDVVEHVHERAVSDQGTGLLSLLREEGMRDHRLPRAPALAAHVVTPVGWIGAVRHPRSWVPWIGLAVIAGWLALVLHLRRAGMRAGRLRAGLLFGVVTIAVGSALAAGAVDLLAAGHAELGRLPGILFRPRLHVVALLLACAAAVMTMFGIARLRFALVELYVGALGALVAGAAWLAVSAPDVAPTVLIVVGISLVQAAVVVALRPPRPRRWLSIASLPMTVGLLAVIVPAFEWSTPALWAAAPDAWGALVAASGLVLLPFLEGALTPRRLAAPMSLAGAGILLAASGLPALRGVERHPELSSLAFVVDAADTTAWAGDGSDRSMAAMFAGRLDLAGPVVLPRAPRRLAGSWLTVPGAGEAWAGSWAVDGETEDRGPRGLLLPREASWAVAGAGPAAELSLPRVDVSGGPYDGGRRTVRLEIRSGLAGLVTGVRLPDGVPASIRRVQGQVLRSPEGVRAVRWWGHTSGSPLRVELSVRREETHIEVDVIEQHLDPRQILGHDFFVRDHGFLPDVSTGSDRMIVRTRVWIRLGREVPALQADGSAVLR
jgi:hypothetical protein